MDIRIDDVVTMSAPDMKKADGQKPTEDFSFTLEKVDKEGLRERLSKQLDDITAKGARLAEHMDIKDMKEYRALVKTFLNDVVSNSHEFSRENFLDRRGRHRVYGIIKLVDKNLDDLAKELLSDQKTSIGILGRVDEIRGLLIDLTL